MSTTSRKYDIAISFLQRDEPLALQIHSELSKNFEVFVYSKKQEELAGTDGLETLRQPFRSDSRIVVVLYRDGWGQTKWTRIEETAIKERLFNEGWDCLLFVMLDSACTPPVWLPETWIRLNFFQYGPDQLIGAIKAKAQSLGSALKIETALDRAARLEQDLLAREERERLLQNQGFSAAQVEFKNLLQAVTRKVQDVNGKVSALKIELGSDARSFALRTQSVAVNAYIYIAQPVTDSRVVMQEWKVPLILPGERKMYFEQPEPVAKKEVRFDYAAAYGWCWREAASGGKFLRTEDLAEYIVGRLLELHDKFARGPHF